MYMVLGASVAIRHRTMSISARSPRSFHRNSASAGGKPLRLK